MLVALLCIGFFFFNDTATTEIYTLSLHDALPISKEPREAGIDGSVVQHLPPAIKRSEEHTSELQSLAYLVCRLLLEKNKYNTLSNFASVLRRNTPPAHRVTFAP